MKTLNEFPLKTFDKIRYADTDRQGHVNNAHFATFLETGRVEVLYNDDLPIRDHDASFVIANLNLSFVNELKWPGQVDIGTAVMKVGTSSINIVQHLFQNDLCVATAETTIVQVKEGKSHPLSEKAKEALSNWSI